MASFSNLHEELPRDRGKNSQTQSTVNHLLCLTSDPVQGSLIALDMRRMRCFFSKQCEGVTDKTLRIFSDLQGLASGDLFRNSSDCQRQLAGRHTPLTLYYMNKKNPSSLLMVYTKHSHFIHFLWQRLPLDIGGFSLARSRLNTESTCKLLCYK